jgi:hypothetical protein
MKPTQHSKPESSSCPRMVVAFSFVLIQRVAHRPVRWCSRKTLKISDP